MARDKVTVLDILRSFIVSVGRAGVITPDQVTEHLRDLGEDDEAMVYRIYREKRAKQLKLDANDTDALLRAVAEKCDKVWRETMADILRKPGQRRAKRDVALFRKVEALITRKNKPMGLRQACLHVCKNDAQEAQALRRAFQRWRTKGHPITPRSLKSKGR